jgi:hypothetical protein
MAEEKDIYFGTPKEIVEFAKVLVPKMAGMMALMAKAVHEKYGDEAIQVIADAVKAAARTKGEKFTQEYLDETPGAKREDINVEIALTKIYAKSHGALGAAGLDLRRQKLTPTESESHTHYCGLCEGWKSMWPEGAKHLCYIYSTEHDVGFMEGVSPRLKWTAHAEQDPSQEGIAHVPHGSVKPGDDNPKPCIMKLKLMPE